MSSLNVSGWPSRVVSRVAMDLADGAHCLGRRWEFATWCAKFHPGASLEAAQRAWERAKAEYRHAGIRFELQARDGVGPLALVFPSTAYLLAVAEELSPIARELPKWSERGPAPTENQVRQAVAELHARRTA